MAMPRMRTAAQVLAEIKKVDPDTCVTLSYIKRVIGLPGDTVEFSGGQLIVNGRPLSEPYVSSETEDMCINLGMDEYFVLGDNRAESYDSRAEDMGCISHDQFCGRVRWILWPVDRFGPIE